MTHDIRRRPILGALGAMMSGLPALVRAQGPSEPFPSRPISIVLPYSAGTGIDAATRSVAEALQKDLKQPVVVLNKVGAGGNIGTEAVVRSAPDGYTVLVVANTIAINPSLYKNLRYDPERDLLPVTLLFKSAMVLVSSILVPSVGLKELVDSSKRDPDKLNYASAGVGTPQHLAMEMLKNATGLSAKHIPHKGAAEAVMSVASGQIELAFVPIQSALPLIANGKLRAVAVSSPQRSPLLPTTPTVAEAIGQAFDVDLWYGMFLPAGTPADVAQTLARSVSAALGEPAFQRNLASLGMSTALSTPGELASLTRSDMARWAAVIKAANISAD